MHTSRKYQANCLYEGDFSLCDYVLTRHAKRRCKERHIKPINVMDAHAIVNGKVVITAWQRHLHNRAPCTKGIEYLRRTNKNKVIPKEVLVHMKDQDHPGQGVKSKGKGAKQGASSKGVKSKRKGAKSRGMRGLSKKNFPLKRCI